MKKACVHGLEKIKCAVCAQEIARQFVTVSAKQGPICPKECPFVAKPAAAYAKKTLIFKQH